VKHASRLPSSVQETGTLAPSAFDVARTKAFRGSGDAPSSPRDTVSPRRAARAHLEAERVDAARFSGLLSHLGRVLVGVARDYQARGEYECTTNGAPSTRAGIARAEELRAKVALLDALVRHFAEPETAFVRALVEERDARQEAERPATITLPMAAASLLSREPSLAIEPNGTGERRESEASPLRRATWGLKDGTTVMPDGRRVPPGVNPYAARRKASPRPSKGGAS
jgi:hypothetical protein